jgi:hypothetical protein
MDKIVSTLDRFKNFVLLYSRVRAGAGAAGAGAAFKCFPGAGARAGTGAA